MKKCTACVFSSTRKEMRLKKVTTPCRPRSIDSHALGGRAAAGSLGSRGRPSVLARSNQPHQSRTSIDDTQSAPEH